MQFLIDVGLALLYFCIFLLICAWSWRFWMMYINQKFLNSLEWVMLEIKLPREIFKSPFATETALASLLQGGGISHKYAKYFKGALPAYSSLEIASLEGVIHFYVRIQKKFRPLVEANFYAQYPGIEIVEADDYTKLIRFHHLTKDVSVWGANYKTKASWKPTNPETGKAYSKSGAKEPKDDGDKYSMRADFIPIKTYTDYGLDKDPKEEFKVDPITPLLEVMGGMGKGEYFWYQILVQDESVYDGTKMPKFYVNEKTHDHVSLAEMATERKKQIRTSHHVIKGDTSVDEFGITKKVDGAPDAEGKPTKVDAKYLATKAVSKDETKLTQDEKDELEAINTKLSKPLALVVMRALYVTKKENFNAAHINDIISLPKPFNGFNSFFPKPTDPYDFPWQNFMGRRVPWRTEEKFEEYVEREGFFPHIDKRESLDKWEDTVFWASSMKSRKLFRMIYEAVLYPFHHPQADDAFVLNLEELATLWHLPGAVAATPTLPRIDSNKGVAPVNLPI